MSALSTAMSDVVGEPPPPPPVPRKRRPWRWVLVVALCLAVVVAGVVVVHQRSTSTSTPQVAVPALPDGTPSLARARAQLGTPPSGGRWFSGAWAGGAIASSKRINDFGTSRGTVSDAVTTYPATDTWETIRGSDWHITTFKSFDGILAYGLPILPGDGSGDFASVVRGEHDDVYRQIANDLTASGRASSIVRIGWEANGDWFPWNAKASDAQAYIAAYRHIVGVLRTAAPDLVIDFDLACGTSMREQQDRLDALNLLYPGDDVVDLVGCDFYDWHSTRSTDQASWEQAIRPSDAVGIADVADFARAHGKGLTYPEWGLASKAEEGVGDNPFFITKMREFFEEQADILVLESYFSEPGTSLANSIFDPVQMPRSAKTYNRLW